jgi:small subunit ribosomal protein S20
MANHPSAEKRNRQRIKRTERNRRVKSTVRSSVKKARASIAAGNLAGAKSDVSEATKALARAASKGIIHVKAASRTTSRIEAALGKLARG